MKIYLNVINPILAVVVLLLCLWAAANGDNGFRPAEALKGGIPTYFVAKGLFCSSALFMLGKLLALLNDKSAK